MKQIESVKKGDVEEVKSKVNERLNAVVEINQVT